MEKDEIYPLIEKYLYGETTPDEFVKLHSWYRSVIEEDVIWLSEEPMEKELVRKRIQGKIWGSLNFPIDDTL